MEMPKLAVEFVPTRALEAYENNAKIHTKEQVRQICNSIQQFGFNDPIAVWGDEIVEGHGRVMAAMELGIERVPVIRLDHLSDEQRRAYTHVHNQLTMNTGFDFETLDEELANLDFDFEELGFDLDNVMKGAKSWFEGREKWDNRREDGNEEYNEFLEKFESKKTTDDCYTPDNVYEAVASFVSERYGIDRADMVRPFYPNGDFESESYPDGCVVVDNPPFSIMARIVRFYCERGIRFFMFANTLTLFSANIDGVCYVPTGVQVVYENGANVNTSFVTNMEDGVKVATFPALYEAVSAANDDNLTAMHADLPKYEYPYEVLTSARAAYMCKYGQELRIMQGECIRVSELDAQKEAGKAIFGGGMLLSERAAAERAAAERAAAERAAAERAAAERWVLSDRERSIVESLGRD